MTYRGHVRNGRVELDEPTALPEGAEIEVTVVPNSHPTGAVHAPSDEESVGLQELEAELDRIWADVPDSEWDKLPADLTDHLDHYLYGTPKR